LRHRYAVTIGVTTAGANRNTRNTLRDLMVLLTPSANNNPIPFWMTVIDTAISSVCRIACRASGSSIMSTKFCRPTNEKSGLRPSQSVRA
jgi:hypothetical protein